MKRAVLLLSLLSLAATLAAAQAASHSSSSFASPSNQVSTAASQSLSTAAENDLRGCLQGSKGNYTLLDHQGKTHKVTGDNHMLWDDSGHEVDMTGTMGGGNSFHETEITDIASRCWNFHLN